MLHLFETIKVFVFDVDGVLTDGMLHVQEHGELLRRMNIKDGYALQLAVKKGFGVWIISGGHSTAVKSRLEKLGIQHIYMSVEDKKEVLLSLMQQYNISKEQVMYIGDDLPDKDAMQCASLKCCPADAAVDIKTICDYISHYPGGLGCARDVIEKTLKIQDKWW